MEVREIIFRGKRCDNNEWVYGSLTQFHDDGIAFICGKYDAIDPNTLGVIPDQDFEYEVYAETVGQWTGLFDKRSDEIFEGDIVSWKIGSIKCVGAIEWGAGEWLKGNPGHNMQSARTYQGSTEIIGNIHDNPELLKTAR